MVPAAPRRDDPVRGEPAEEVPGHLPVRLRDPTDWQRALAELRERVPVLDRPGRADLPGRQPAHQAVRVLGVGDRRDQARSTPTRSSWPRRSPARRSCYRLAKVGFTQSYTYFPWRNTKAELTEYLTELTQRPVARVLPAEPLAEHAGHPARVPPVRRAARVRRPARPRGDARPELRASTVRRSSSAIADAAGAGQRGVPRLREVRDPALGPRPGRHPRPADRAGQPDPPREPGAPGRTTPALPRVDNEQLIAYSQGDARPVEQVAGGRQPRPAPRRSRGSLELPLDEIGLDPSQPFQVHDLLTDARYLWHGRAQLRRASTQRGSPRTSSPAPQGANRARLRLLPLTAMDRPTQFAQQLAAHAESGDALWFQDAVIYELRAAREGPQ